MLDKFDREINYLRVSITDRCNLRCRYCRPKEGFSLQGHQDILRYEEIIRVVRIAVKMGFIKIRVTGGEPLVRRGVVDFLASLKNIAGLQDISLTTNGILLEKYACAIFAAGVHRINISLDSLDSEKYSHITGGGDIAAVLRGIAKAEETGFSPIKINTVVIKGFNDDEVLAFARLAVDKPFQVRFIELMPLGKAQSGQDSEYLPTTQVLEKVSSQYTLKAIPGKTFKSDGPARRFKIKGGLGEIGFINPVSNHFCSSCNRLRLTADGKLMSCLLQREEIDLKTALRQNCGDAELENIIREAILSKPGHHDLNCSDNNLKKCRRDMSAIGG